MSDQLVKFATISTKEASYFSCGPWEIRVGPDRDEVSIMPHPSATPNASIDRAALFALAAVSDAAWQRARDLWGEPS